MSADVERIGLVRGERVRRTDAENHGWRATKLALGAIAVLAAVCVGVGGRRGRAIGAAFGGLARLGVGADSADSAESWTHEDWRVVSFVDAEYEDIGKRWYHRLSNLGYKTHYLVALDDEVYDKLEKAKLRVLRAPGFTLEKGGDLSDFWRFRLTYLADEIKRGHNVLLSDVDVIFAHHYDPVVIFNKAGDEEVDIYHSLGAGWPHSAKKQWGFSICMGFSAFRATRATEQILEAAVKVCDHEAHCDDQVVMNELYMKYLQMSWTTNLAPGERKGISRNTMIPLVVKTLSNLVPRIDLKDMTPIKPSSKNVQCFGHTHHVDGGHWAVAPIIEKDGRAKVDVWDQLHDECFPATISALGAQWTH